MPPGKQNDGERIPHEQQILLRQADLTGEFEHAVEVCESSFASADGFFRIMDEVRKDFAHGLIDEKRIH